MVLLGFGILSATGKSIKAQATRRQQQAARISLEEDFLPCCLVLVA
jgi:hypothetical protein